MGGTFARLRPLTALPALALITCLGACDAPLPLPPPRPAPPLAATTPAPVAPSTTATAAPALPNRTAMAAVVEELYRQHAQGHGAEARAALERLLRLVPSGSRLEPGLGDTAGSFAAARGGIAAFQTGVEPTVTQSLVFQGIVSFGVGPRDGGGGALFFRADSGEPFAFEPRVLLAFLPGHNRYLPAPALFATYVPADADESDLAQALYDPMTRKYLAKSRYLQVRPDGAEAYTFDPHCRWYGWDLSRREVYRILEELARPGPCNVEQSASAYITSNGRWLIAGAFWNLQTGSIRTAKGSQVLLDGPPPASPDGRYIAHFRTRKPGSINDAFAGRVIDLVLFDTRTGAETSAADHAFATLSNSSPLDFIEQPLRLRVTDYTQWAFSVPGLRLLARSPPPDGRSTPLTAAEKASLKGPSAAAPALPEQDTTALRRKLDARVCHVAGFVVPRAVCEPLLASPAPPPAP